MSRSKMCVVVRVRQKAMCVCALCVGGLCPCVVCVRV